MANTPAPSTPQLDLMRRLKVREGQHDDLGMPFLEEEERQRLDHILAKSVEKGITDKVQRQAHDFLVMLGQRDATLGFLTVEERQELTALTRLEPPTTSGQKSKPKRKHPMSGGEFLVATGIIVSVATASYLTYDTPATSGSAIWVAIWGLVCGSSFIADTRRRSYTADGKVSIPEGLLAAVIWGVAAAAVVLLSGDHQLGLGPGWTALLSFFGAGLLGRSLLKIKDD